MTRRATIPDAIEPSRSAAPYPDQLEQLGIESGEMLTVTLRRDRITQRNFRNWLTGRVM